MSSEISTDPVRIEPDTPPAARPTSDPLHPWQLFALAGLIGATIVVFMSRGQSPAAVIFLSVIVFSAAVVGLAALRTLTPLVGHFVDAAPRVVTGRARAALDRDKVLALRAIKELEFDHAMGKVSSKDFAEMSARLRARATRLIRQMDTGSGYRDEIEREVARRLEKTESNPKFQTPNPKPQTSNPKSQTSNPESQGPDPDGERSGSRICAGCRTENDSDARFCKRCGASLELHHEA